MSPLTQAQAADARVIARQEALDALALLAHNVAATPARADGNLNAHDFCATISLTITQFDAGGRA